jgi:hypothetical protein
VKIKPPTYCVASPAFDRTYWSATNARTASTRRRPTRTPRQSRHQQLAVASRFSGCSRCRCGSRRTCGSSEASAGRVGQVDPGTGYVVSRPVLLRFGKGLPLDPPGRVGAVEIFQDAATSSLRMHGMLDGGAAEAASDHEELLFAPARAVAGRVLHLPFHHSASFNNFDFGYLLGIARTQDAFFPDQLPDQIVGVLGADLGCARPASNPRRIVSRALALSSVHWSAIASSKSSTSSLSSPPPQSCPSRNATLSAVSLRVPAGCSGQPLQVHVERLAAPRAHRPAVWSGRCDQTWCRSCSPAA